MNIFLCNWCIFVFRFAASPLWTFLTQRLSRKQKPEQTICQLGLCLVLQQARLAQLELQPTEEAWYRSRFWHFFKAGCHPRTHPHSEDKQANSTFSSDTQTCFFCHVSAHPVGIWMYITKGALVHIKEHSPCTLLIYRHLHMVCTYSKRLGSVCLDLWVQQQHCILFVCLQNWSTMKGLLLVTEMWRNKEGKRKTRMRGNKLNGEWGQKKRKTGILDWESRASCTVAVLCLVFDDEFIWCKRQQRGACFKHQQCSSSFLFFYFLTSETSSNEPGRKASADLLIPFRKVRSNEGEWVVRRSGMREEKMYD